MGNYNVSIILKLLLSILLYSQVNPNCLAQSNTISPADPEAAAKQWFEETLPTTKEKLTKLRFYFHDIVTGKNPTSITVAQPNSSNTSPTRFGIFNVMDDALTEGPKPDSKIVGRARGTFAQAGLDDLSLLMTFTFVFTDGKFNGSTISVVGNNMALHKYREMPVVGGTGIFRLARGLAIAKIIEFTLATKNALVEYNLMVMHY